MGAVAKSGSLEGLVQEYLGRSHRDRPETGCVFAALGSEIARLSRKTRSVLTGELSAFLDLVAGELPEQIPTERRRKALQIVSVLVGSLQLARAIDDQDLSDGILNAGRLAALVLAESESN
ncbi:hypothetical protein [Bradyrhizobium ivorense]|uniref:hypothetical protein n=1 Tax=Bradyrhizobium ivorense TaxID=2511166 RepID=UPI001E3F868D|nr:hypothetical protein [Bradyrhizobium ivorense]